MRGALTLAFLGVVAGFWFGEVMIGLIIGVAMLVNLIMAALAGATIPLLMRRFGADPALSSSVVLTTVTDVVGFSVFLGLATLLLL